MKTIFTVLAVVLVAGLVSAKPAKKPDEPPPMYKEVEDCPDQCQVLIDEESLCDVKCLYVEFPCPEDCVEEDDPSCEGAGSWCPAKKHHDEPPRYKEVEDCPEDCEVFIEEKDLCDIKCLYVNHTCPEDCVEEDDPACEGAGSWCPPMKPKPPMLKEVEDCPELCQVVVEEKNLCDIKCLYVEFPCPEDCVEEDDPACEGTGSWCPMPDKDEPRPPKPDEGESGEDRPPKPDDGESGEDRPPKPDEGRGGGRGGRGRGGRGRGGRGRGGRRS